MYVFVVFILVASQSYRWTGALVEVIGQVGIQLEQRQGTIGAMAGGEGQPPPNATLPLFRCPVGS